jgi:outer membrane protein
MLAPGLAMATDGTLKIGVVDWQQLLAKAPQAEQAGKRLEKEFQAPKDRLIAKQKEFQTKREKAQRDKDVMSAAEKAKKEKELVKLEQDLRHMDEELRADYSSRHQEEMNAFMTKVREVIDQLAKEEKYDLVLPQETTHFISERLDVTEKVLDKLSKLKLEKTETKEKS